MTISLYFLTTVQLNPVFHFPQGRLGRVDAPDQALINSRLHLTPRSRCLPHHLLITLLLMPNIRLLYTHTHIRTANPTIRTTAMKPSKAPYYKYLGMLEVTPGLLAS